MNRGIAMGMLLIFCSAGNGFPQGLTLDSPTPQDEGYFGCAFAAVGDIDGDGLGDVVVGAEGEAKVHVFSGSDGDLLATISSPSGATWGEFGCDLDGVGDIDGDGYGDFIAGAAEEGTYGRAYVISGRTGLALLTLEFPGPGFGGFFGGAVAGVGDLNGDGVADLLVGDKAADSAGGPIAAGRVYLFSGSDGSLIRTIVSPQEASGALFGSDVAGITDLDGDNVNEIIVAAEQEDGPDAVNAGRVYVLSGATGGLIRILSSPVEQDYAYFGRSARSAGDVNGDELDDVIVGVMLEDVDGRAYVFDGATGLPILTLASPLETSSAYFGCSVAGLGDVNGDGYSDVAVGAQYESPGGSPFLAGRAHIFSGATGVALATVSSPNEQHEGYFGCSVAVAGDVDGDGTPDLLVGAEREEPSSGSRYVGRAYIFSPASVRGPVAPPPTMLALRVEGPFPNPTRDRALLYVNPPPGTDIADMRLFDSAGRVVHRVEGSSLGAGSGSVVWVKDDATPPGSYVWIVSTTTEQITAPMVILP